VIWVLRRFGGWLLSPLTANFAYEVDYMYPVS